MRKQRELQGLRETGAALQTNARKLPPGPDRDKLLQDIARFRAQVAALQAMARISRASLSMNSQG
jgi:hypothetical protein